MYICDNTYLYINIIMMFMKFGNISCAAKRTCYDQVVSIFLRVTAPRPLKKFFNEVTVTLSGFIGNQMVVALQSLGTDPEVDF